MNALVKLWRAKRQRALEAARKRRANNAAAAASRKRPVASNASAWRAKRQRAVVASRKRRANSNANNTRSMKAGKSLMSEWADLQEQLHRPNLTLARQLQVWRRIRNLEHTLRAR